MTAGCDRQSGEKAQPQPSSQAAAPKDTPSVAPSGVIDRSHKGSQLPEFTFTDPNGKTLRIQDLKGKPLLVNLWATWCAPCVVEMPALEKLAASKGAALQVLTISQDMQEPDKVASFFKERGFTHLKPWLDPKNDLAFHYGATTLPMTVFYGADGREIWRFAGERDWTDAETTKLLVETGDTK